MLMKVKAVEHGFLGDCGVFYKVALRDRYLCFDKRENEITYCHVDSWSPTRTLHLCCSKYYDCDDFTDYNTYAFDPSLYNILK
jgi:hypothetical protein